MGKRFSTSDLSKTTDDKALAIAAFGESVAAYRYIILSEKARDARLRDSFEQRARHERAQRDRLPALLQPLAPPPPAPPPPPPPPPPPFPPPRRQTRRLRRPAPRRCP